MADGHSGLKVYIAASFRHLHAARLLGRAIRAMGYGLLDWTELAKPPEGLTPAERRAWMDTDHGGEVFAFCERACREADFVVYLGASGQDAGVEVGLARAWGVPVLGIRGPLEAPGLMLYGAASVWVESVEAALNLLEQTTEWAGRRAARRRGRPERMRPNLCGAYWRNGRKDMARKKRVIPATREETRDWLYKSVRSAPRPLPAGRFPLLMRQVEAEGCPHAL